VPYEERAKQAREWAREHAVAAAAGDRFRLALVLVDVQNTFCIPDHELFVGGRSGNAAVDDSRRLASFLYRNLASITRVVPTLDTHHLFQIFHAAFLVDERGEPPPPYTLVTTEDIVSGRWRFDPLAAEAAGLAAEKGQRHLLHYVRTLQAGGKYALTIWPYHAMLGGIGHALVPLVEEAVFFHGVARASQADFRVKGSHALTEHYSVLGPEVTTGADGHRLGAVDRTLVESLLAFDAVVIAGQAKSHCVAWTIEDLLHGMGQRRDQLARRVYLLEDCTSPVVVPGAIDYSDEAERAFARFAQAGMHVVRSTAPLSSWPDLGR
jgi:nicotinamidase-related amidase